MVARRDRELLAVRDIEESKYIVVVYRELSKEDG